MKIEVGKTYKDRQGAEIEITGTTQHNLYPFIGTNADGQPASFTSSGMYYYDDGESDFDLIEEVLPSAPATAPVGSTYDPPRLWALLRSTWGQGTVLPDNSAERKEFPIAEGFDGYFPAATVAVAGWSKMANAKHNPGQPLNHARGKSADHADCQRRHALDALDPKRDRLEELTCKAWRALAELQEYAETLGAPPAPAATFPEAANG